MKNKKKTATSFSFLKKLIHEIQQKAFTTFKKLKAKVNKFLKHPIIQP